MSIYTKIIKLSTKGFTDIIDITEEVNEAVKLSGIADGFAVPSENPGLGITWDWDAIAYHSIEGSYQEFSISS